MCVICYINNQPMTSRQCKLFDLYQKYLAGNATKQDFINFEGYGNTFEVAKSIYEKVMKGQTMLSDISNKDKKKFDIALINSCIVYWYMKNMDNTYDSYMDRINDYLEWMKSKPSERVKYNALKFAKDFILKHKLTDEFLRDYCFELEHNNPREKWNKQLRK